MHIDELLKESKATNELELVREMVKDNQVALNGIRTDWDEYKGEVPIKTRELEIGNELKLNNKIANDFRGLIVDQLNGYLFGTPIKYKMESDKEQETITEFNTRNNIDDLDSITGIYSGACGYGVRMLFIDEGVENVMNANPWEFIFLDDGTVMRVFKIEIHEDDNVIIKKKVEWYDDKEVNYFVSVNNNPIPANNPNGIVPVTIEEFVRDPEQPVNPKPHLFDLTPIIKFKANELEQSEFHKVKSNIDAYDRVVSDTQNEIEEFRLAYMVFTGTEPDEETMKQARKVGGFGVNVDETISFLTKEVNDDFVEHTKDTHEKNIYRFGRAVDMADKEFSGGAQSGESRKWKLVDLENKANLKERKTTNAIKQTYKILQTAWKKKGIAFDWMELELTYTRTLPADLLNEAKIQRELRGSVTDETRLAQASFVVDAKEEATALKEELPEVNLDNIE